MSTSVRGKVRAAAVQLAPALGAGSRAATSEKICAAIRAAAREGATLVVFPETVVPYYPYFSFIQAPAAMGKEHLLLYEEAVTVPGPTVEAVAEAMRTTCGNAASAHAEGAAARRAHDRPARRRAVTP